MSGCKRKINMKKRIGTIVAVIVLLAVSYLLKEFNGENDLQVTGEQISVQENTEQSAEVLQPSDTVAEELSQEETAAYVNYTFRNKKYLNEHFEKHGKAMGFESSLEYQSAASDVVNNPEALHKIEKEDGDDVYYLEATNDFVIVSTDGYIRTYFWPDSGIKYYNKQ